MALILDKSAGVQRHRCFRCCRVDTFSEFFIFSIAERQKLFPLWKKERGEAAKNVDAI